MVDEPPGTHSYPHFPPVAGTLPRRHHRRFFSHAWRRIHLSLGLRLLPCVLEQQGSGETEKTPPETEQAAGLPGSMIGFKSGETRQPTQVLNGCFASLQVFVAIGCAHAKGVRLASRSLFSQRLDAWRRAVECRGNGRGGHDKKILLEKRMRTRMQILLPGLCQGVGFRYGKK